MCTAVLSIAPGLPTLIIGIRDELTDRAWQPPGRHWPEYPGLIGGLDLVAGGTWLAVAPAERRVACVLNGRGVLAPAQSRRSRGALPLQAAAGRVADRAGLAGFDPFHLLTVQPARAVLQSWDGTKLTDRKLGPGLHFVVNSGLASDLTASDTHERIAHFVPRFTAAARPAPVPGEPVADAWGTWLTLVNGDGLDTGDPAALIVGRDLGDGRTWGTTSISLVAITPAYLRYDFTGAPGNPAAWHPVETGV
jgi:hypothetical protein